MKNPLLEAGSFSVGSRVAFRTGGRALDPIDGQFIMDFSDSSRVVETTAGFVPIDRAESVVDLFARGVSLEEDPIERRRGDCQLPEGSETRSGLRSRAHQSRHALLQPVGLRTGGGALPQGHRMPIRAMRWPTSIWEMCWTKRSAWRRQSPPTRPRCSLLPPTRTRITTWRLPTNARGSRALRSGTGAPTSSWMAGALGRCMPARSTESCWSPRSSASGLTAVSPCPARTFSVAPSL